jgi:hypothetical protein
MTVEERGMQKRIRGVWIAFSSSVGASLAFFHSVRVVLINYVVQSSPIIRVSCIGGRLYSS